MTCNSLECICVDTSRCINRGTWGGREVCAPQTGHRHKVPHRHKEAHCEAQATERQRGLCLLCLWLFVSVAQRVCGLCVCGSVPHNVPLFCHSARHRGAQRHRDICASALLRGSEVSTSFYTSTAVCPALLRGTEAQTQRCEQRHKAEQRRVCRKSCLLSF